MAAPLIGTGAPGSKVWRATLRGRIAAVAAFLAL